MWLERIAGGPVDLVDFEDAKSHLRLLEGDFDAEVNRAVSAASAFLDVDEDGFGGLGFPLVDQQWALKLPRLGVSVRLPFSRVRSVDRIDVVASDETVSAVPADTYMLVKTGRVWNVVLKEGQQWPISAARPDAFSLQFTAGWSDVGGVPADIKAAARLLIGHFFRNREAAAAGEVPAEIQLGVERLVSRYRNFGA